MQVPTPYKLRWTAKLLCRDIRNLATRGKIHLSSKVAKASGPKVQEHVDVVIVEAEGPRHTKVVALAECAVVSSSSQLYSLIILTYHEERQHSMRNS